MILQFFQVGKHRARVACPENNDIHILRFKRNMGNLLPVKGIGHGAITGPDAVHEPFRIKSRNVCATTGTDYHFLSRVASDFCHIFVRTDGYIIHKTIMPLQGSKSFLSILYLTVPYHLISICNKLSCSRIGSVCSLHRSDKDNTEMYAGPR